MRNHNKIQMYVTSSDYHKALTPCEIETGASETPNISVLTEEKFQIIDGIGASFTDSSAYLIHQVLPEDRQNELMQELFDPDKGIGLSYLRNPMGSSDFAREIHSYCDSDAPDPELLRFSLEIDREDILPLTQQALRINPQLKVMGSPWSPPAWMKSGQNMVGGQLLTEYYGAYAEYFVKYIEGYAENGISIYAVTPQNEALYSPGDYAGMLFPAEEEAVFIRDYLKPSFQQAGIQTKIFCYDHNWDRPDYPATVFDMAGDQVDGVAWHYYGGSPEIQTELYNRYPQKEVYFTEASSGEWVKEGLIDGVVSGIHIFNNYGQTYIRWNIALDENNGPTVPPFVRRSTCHGVYRINQQEKTVERMEDFYILAHFSKFVRPGARRIVAQSSLEALETAAFQNPDGTVAVVLANTSSQEKRFCLAVDGDRITAVLEGKSVATLIFPSC